jgi:RecA-family ATPase
MKMTEHPPTTAEVVEFPGRGQDGGHQPLPWVDMSNWDHEPIPQRRWAIQDRVPGNQAGLFSGEGGTGKSLVELSKNVAHVTGKDWLGSMPEPGPAIYIGAEDNTDEVHIRLASIAQHYGVTFRELIDGGLHVLCLLGEDATLCAPARNGKIETTQLYEQIYQAAGDIKPRNISIDTLSRAFAGNEIDRAQVYQFATFMQRLALVTDGGSVTILSHPSLAGMSSGSGLSGSTGWQGAFRFHQYLRSAKAEGDDEPDRDLRELVFRKNQYGPLGENIILRYQRGLFLPEAGMSSLEKLARESKADEIFLHLLRRFESQGRNVSDKARATSYAPRAFAADPEANKVKLRMSELEGAMKRLFAAGKIKVTQYGRPSDPHTKLVAN